MSRKFMVLMFALPLVLGSCKGDPNQASADLAQTRKLSVEEFVRQTFIEGVPYEQASRFRSERDIETLTRLLADRSQIQYWPNMVMTLGMAGGQKAVDALVKFFESGKGVLSPEEYRAKLNVPIALGYALAAESGKRETSAGLTLLQSGVDPEAWKMSGIEWYPPAANMRQRDIQLTRRTIQGLGISGSPAAAASLSAEKQRIKAGKTGAVEMANLVDEALKKNEQVRMFGLKGDRKPE